mmetsp:Transcript_19713/g.56348  ORF Transcript_19713/g.56348 Transcript_19713/m.56348 type:complete len:211 (+) Transcript_19713:396-1028(+)
MATATATAQPASTRRSFPTVPTLRSCAGPRPRTSSRQCSVAALAASRTLSFATLRPTVAKSWRSYSDRASVPAATSSISALERACSSSLLPRLWAARARSLPRRSPKAFAHFLSAGAPQTRRLLQPRKLSTFQRTPSPCPMTLWNSFSSATFTTTSRSRPRRSRSACAFSSPRASSFSSTSTVTTLAFTPSRLAGWKSMCVLIRTLSAPK